MYTYKEEEGLYCIYVKNVEDGRPIRKLQSEELAKMWIEDMNTCHELGYEEAVNFHFEDEDSKYIVVICDTHYPSVFHFENIEEAEKCKENYKGEGAVIHLAKIEGSDFYKEDWKIEHLIEKYETDNLEEIPIKEFDIKWC